jgi:hypothetical protein
MVVEFFDLCRSFENDKSRPSLKNKTFKCKKFRLNRGYFSLGEVHVEKLNEKKKL